MKAVMRTTVLYEFESDLFIYLVNSANLDPIPDAEIAYAMASQLVRRQSEANTLSRYMT